MNRAGFLLALAMPYGLLAVTALESGKPVTFTLPAVTQSTLYIGDYSYRIQVPAGATKLTIDLASDLPHVDVDLFVRLGKDLDLADGKVVADYSSQGDTASERVVIDLSSSPPLQAGGYYIGFGVFTKNVEIPLTLTATVEAPDTTLATLLTTQRPEICSRTAVRSFYLSNGVRLQELRALYQWGAQESSVEFKLYQGYRELLAGELKKGACEDDKSAWCVATYATDTVLASGSYRLQVARPQVCAGTEGGAGVVELLGQPLPEEKLVTMSQASIGAGGGRIDGEVTIDAPPQAFEKDTTIQVQAVDSAEPSSGSLMSKVYQINGLGSSQRRDVEITIPLAKEPVGSLFAVLTLAGAPGLDRPTMLPVRVEGGKAFVTIPGVEGYDGSAEVSAAAARPSAGGWRRATRKAGTATLIDPASISSRLALLGGFAEEKSPTGRFVVHYPMSGDAVTEFAEDLAIHLDAVEAKLKQMQVRTELRKSAIHIYLATSAGTEGKLFRLVETKPGEGVPDGVQGCEQWDPYNVGYTLNIDSMNERERLRYTAAHELLHVYQAAFDPRNAGLLRVLGQPHWLWLEEAMSTWFERAWADHPKTFTPVEARKYRFYFIAHGLHYSTPSDENDSHHGYGAASLLEHFAPVNGASATLLGKLMDVFHESKGSVWKQPKYCPVDGLEAATGQPWFIAWIEYLNSLLDGYVYPNISMIPGTGVFSMADLPEAVAMSPGAQAFNYKFDAAKTGEQKFSQEWQAGPLSAAAAQLAFPTKGATSGLGSGAALEVRAKAGGADTHIWVYRYLVGEKKMERLYAGVAPYSLKDAEKLFDASTYLYIYVANTDAGLECDDRQTSMSLEVVLTPGIANPLSAAKTFSIFPYGKAEFTYTGPGASYTTSNISWFSAFGTSACNPTAANRIVWSGRVFSINSATSCTQGGGDPLTGTGTLVVTGKMNAAFTAIDDLQLDQVITWRSQSGNSDRRDTVSVCLTDLPADNTAKYKSYYVTVPGDQVPAAVCGLTGMREDLKADKVTGTFVLKSVDWSSGMLKVSLE